MKNLAATGKTQNRLADQAGLITLDFIFAFTVSICVAMVFFAVTVSLSLVEIAQYVTFTTSRAYAGAHETQQMQQDLANSRYAEVMALPAFKTFLSQQWFQLSPPQLGDFSSEYPETAAYNQGAFVGARVTMNARLLNLNVPFLGATVSDSGVGKATLNSYLMREVSTTECRENFTRARYQQLRNSASGSYSNAPNATEVLITDNGC